MKIIRIISAAFVVLGLAALAAAVSEYRDRAAFVDNASAATGEVTKLTQRVHSGRKSTSTYYTFTVRFTTPRGDPVEAEAMDSSTAPIYVVGERVPILFARTNIKDFTFDHFTMLWGDVILFAVVGGGFLGAGLSAFGIAGGRRGGEYQSKLVALAFVGFFLLSGTILFALFAPWVVQVIVAAILIVIAFGAVHARRRHNRRPNRNESP